MSYRIQEVNGCTKKFIFNIDQVDLSEQIQSALKQKQKSAKLKGFRPGKAPISVIENMYRPQVENEALSSFIGQQFQTAVVKEDIRMVGYPIFGGTKYEQEKKTIEFEATVEIFPEFELNEYSSYSFDRESDKVEEEEIEETKKSYLDSKATMNDVEDEEKALENGDFAIINFKGIRANGDTPESMQAQDYLLEIGSGRFIPGFEEGILGLKKGEDRTIEVTFPEDYQQEDLQNEKVNFEVTLNKIQTKTYPELTDELAKEFGFETKDEFNTKVGEQIKDQRERQVTEDLHSRILQKFVDENKFDLPNALVLNQLEHLKKDTSAQLKQSGFNDEMIEQYFEKWSDDLKTKADFQVRSGLILNKLADSFEIEVEEKDFDEKIEAMAKQSRMETEELKKIYLGNDQIKKNLEYAIREEKTFGQLKEKMTINQK